MQTKTNTVEVNEANETKQSGNREYHASNTYLVI